MLTDKTGLKKKLLTTLIYILVGLTGLFYSFKPANIVNNNKTEKQGRNWTDSMTWWIKEMVNKGDGYNFATEEDNSVPRKYSYQIQENAQSPAFPVINYDLFVPENHELFVPEASLNFDYSDIPAFSESEQVKEEKTVLAAISSFIPSEMAGSVSETQAQQLIEKAASVSSSDIERIKNNPRLLSKARSMDINALINYKTD